MIYLFHDFFETLFYCTVDDFSGGKNKGRTLKNDLDAPIPAPESDETSKRVLPSGTFLMSERTCWTSQGQMGTCGSLRSCYPNIQLQYNFESLIFGGRSTCVFTDHTGRQVIFKKFNFNSIQLN